MDTFIWVVNMLSRIAGVVAAFFVALAVVVICDMVIERYIFNLTTIWQLDVVTYSIIATTFIGSAYVLMTRGHVNVDVLPIYLGPRARYWLAIFANLLALSFCLLLFVLCTRFWYQSWIEGLALGHGLARAAVDSLFLDAGRARALGPAIHCRFDRRRHRAYAEPFNLTHEEHVA